MKREPEVAYRATKKTMLGMELLKKMNEWKDAGGSDVDMLLALDDFIARCIERSSDQTTEKP